MTKKIILASTSPRRKILMKKLGLPFIAIDSGYEEFMDQKLSAQQLVILLSLGKARSASKKYPNATIVAGDTVVMLGGKILGKPKNEKDAQRVLRMLSGKINRVITGLVVLDGNTKQVVQTVVITKVWMKKLSEQQITNYISTREPFDRAGSYSVDGKYGRHLVRKIAGDFDAAMGLPVRELKKILKKFIKKPFQK